MMVGPSYPSTQVVEAKNCKFKTILSLHSKFETLSHKILKMYMSVKY